MTSTGEGSDHYWIYVTHRTWGPSCDEDDLLLTRAQIEKRYPNLCAA